jgi:hypothetical protein
VFIQPPRHQSAKPRHDHHADKPAERSGDTPKSAPDQKKPILCFICNQPGHLAHDHEPDGKVHIQATHMEQSDGEANGEREEDNTKSLHHEPEADDHNAPQHSDNKMVEIDAYNNNWYEWASVLKQMFTI